MLLLYYTTIAAVRMLRTTSIDENKVCNVYPVPWVNDNIDVRRPNGGGDLSWWLTTSCGAELTKARILAVRMQ